MKLIMKHLWIILLISFNAHSQVVRTLTVTPKTSIRGMSVISDDVIWVSGSNGYVGRSTDAGKTWKWIRVPNFEKSEFRGIRGFNEKTAVVMASGDPGYIVRTEDGGEHWTTVYMNKVQGIFLDAMTFWDDNLGIVVGDPIRNKFVIARTYDGGRTWHDLSPDEYPDAATGEALFAASGTNIRTMDCHSYFVTGGMKSKLYRDDASFDIPILQGSETSGANSIALKNNVHFIVVGGDFNKPTLTDRNCVMTKDGGRTWISPEKAPGGYRSCVEYIARRVWITCGLNGVDITDDDGKTWKNISTDSYNVCRKARRGSAIYLAGSGGSIGVVQW
jgi:photosystem II stability/assembly factor-like uncharacterized protein